MDPRQPLDDHPALAELARRRAGRLLPDFDEPDFPPPPGSTFLILHLVPRDSAWAIGWSGVSGHDRNEAAPTAHERMAEAVLADELQPLLLDEAEALLPARAAAGLGVGVALARCGDPRAGGPTRWFFDLAEPTPQGAIDSRLGSDAGAFHTLAGRLRALAGRLGPLLAPSAEDTPWWKAGTEIVRSHTPQSRHQINAVLRAPDARSAALLTAARHATAVFVSAKATELPPDPLPITLRYVHLHCPPSADEITRIGEAIDDLLRPAP